MLTSDPKDWNILLVDDEPDNLRVLEMVLGYHGSTVTSLKSGQAALEAMRQNVYDLALLDIRMPVLSGYDVLRHIRELPNPDQSDMVLIAITAHAMAGDRERMIAAGFNGYISKPVDVPTIMETIRKIVEEYLDMRGRMMD